MVVDISFTSHIKHAAPVAPELEAPICSFANFAVLPPKNSKYFISASIDDYVLHSVERKNA